MGKDTHLSWCKICEEDLDRLHIHEGMCFVCGGDIHYGKYVWKCENWEECDNWDDYGDWDF